MNIKGQDEAMAARKLPTTLTDDELRRLLRQVNVRSMTGLRNKAALKVMAYGGLRVSEVVALRTQDIRREDGRIALEIRGGKGGRDRTVPLPDHAGDTLEAWLAKRRDLGIGNGRVFCTLRRGLNIHPVSDEDGFVAGEVTETTLEPGQPTQRAYWSALVSRLAKRAGIEKRVTPHVLRHTAATRMLREVGNIRRVQELLGHSSVSTTMIYTEVLAEDLAEAVDAVPDVEADDREAEAGGGQSLVEALAALPAEAWEDLERLITSMREEREAIDGDPG